MRTQGKSYTYMYIDIMSSDNLTRLASFKGYAKKGVQKKVTEDQERLSSY